MALCILFASETSGNEDHRPLVAAASSLRQVWPELMAGWQGPEPRISFAASGTLAQQIRNGAPFEVFLSADRTSIEAVAAARLTESPPASFARGTLMLVFRREPGRQAPPVSNDSTASLVSRIDQVLDDPNARLALANPRHAPYGQAAVQVLEAIGRREQVAARQVLGENAAQTLQFVQIGAARAGLIPASLSGAVDDRRFDSLSVEPGLHHDILHHRVLIKGASTSATRLFHWLVSPTAQRTLRQAGLMPLD